MDKEIVEKFLGKFVKLEKRTVDPNNPYRSTFKLYGTIEAVTDISVIIHTDHDGAVLLEDVVSIEEWGG